MLDGISLDPVHPCERFQNVKYRRGAVKYAEIALPQGCHVPVHRLVQSFRDAVRGLVTE